MTLEQWKAKGSYFNFKGHNLFTIDEGKGPALLLIHGFPTASHDWWQMWPQLVAHYRVLTLDMLGFGFSDKPKKHVYSIVEQAEIIVSFLSRSSVKSVKVLSHDYGDSVAQELLARHNEDGLGAIKIESVCFLNGGLFPEMHRPLLIQKLLMSPLGSTISKLFTRKKLAKNFRKIFGPNTQPTEEELDMYWELITTNGGNKISHLLIRYMADRKVHRNRWVNAITNSKVPLRLINGVLDPISGQHLADRYREQVPNADVIELSEIGHFPLIEAPELVLKHYLEFLDSHN